MNDFEWAEDIVNTSPIGMVLNVGGKNIDKLLKSYHDMGFKWNYGKNKDIVNVRGYLNRTLNSGTHHLVVGPIKCNMLFDIPCGVISTVWKEDCVYFEYDGVVSDF